MMPFDRDLRDLLRATKAMSRSPAENIQRQLETDLEMAERHVREAEARVARQRRIVEYQRASGEVSSLSEEILEEFERALVHHRLHLSRFRPRKLHE